MKALKIIGVVALTLCMAHSAYAMTLGGSIHGSGWLPQASRPGITWTKAEHAQAQQDAIDNANELLELHISLQMLDFPTQEYADHMILEDFMGFYPEDPAHYTYSIASYLIVFQNGQFVVIYP